MAQPGLRGLAAGLRPSETRPASRVPCGPFSSRPATPSLGTASLHGDKHARVLGIAPSCAYQRFCGTRSSSSSPPRPTHLPAVKSSGSKHRPRRKDLKNPVALNLKSRAEASSRDSRSLLHITHKSLYFLFLSAAQDGEFVFFNPGASSGVYPLPSASGRGRAGSPFGLGLEELSRAWQGNIEPASRRRGANGPPPATGFEVARGAGAAPRGGLAHRPRSCAGCLDSGVPAVTRRTSLGPGRRRVAGAAGGAQAGCGPCRGQSARDARTLALSGVEEQTV